jgi:hypothetical protein
MAQQPKKIARIGYLAVNSSSADRHLDETFKQSLRELGWIEGRNIAIEYRSAEGKTDRLPDLAAELVRLNVDVILSTGGTPGAQAAKKATGTIPIVFTSFTTPRTMDREFIQSHRRQARPGRNSLPVLGLGVASSMREITWTRSHKPRRSHLTV